MQSLAHQLGDFLVPALMAASAGILGLLLAVVVQRLARSVAGWRRAFARSLPAAAALLEPLRVVAVATGLLDIVFAQLFFLTAIAFGALISVNSVLLEELSFRRYPASAI